MAPLDYSRQRPPWRRTLRVLVMGVLSAALAISIWRCGPTIWHGLVARYWWRQCAMYMASPNQIAYADGAKTPVVLWDDGRTDQAAPIVHSENPEVRATAIHCWHRFLSAHDVDGWSQDGLIFLHGRQSPSGMKRLIAVELTQRSHGTIELHYILLNPLDEPGEILGGSDHFMVDWHYCGRDDEMQKLTIFAGQPDPSDPAAFFIPFNWGGHTGRFLGSINNSGGLDLLTRLFDTPPPN
jgi:hypothetical protein